MEYLVAAAIVSFPLVGLCIVATIALDYIDSKGTPNE